MSSNPTIRSMTAFARQEATGEWGSLVCEMRSVNHRYLEPVFRLPEMLRDLESSLREQVRNRLGRGKLEVQLRLELTSGDAGHFQLDMEAVESVNAAINRVNRLLDNPAHISALDVMRWPGVVVHQEPDLEPVRASALQLFSDTLAQLEQARIREGERLKPLLEDRLTQVESHVESLRGRLPGWREHQIQQLRDRLSEAGASLEDERLAQEVAILAQKSDVAEELDRLDAHVSEVRDTLQRGEPMGRRLDFLMQELNREANTLSSKSIAAELTQVAVELKVLIEQMREQVQNIE